MAPTLLTHQVAEILGLSRQHTQRLDEALRPRRSEDGHRHYDPAVVEAFATERELRRAARASR